MNRIPNAVTLLFAVLASLATSTHLNGQTPVEGVQGATPSRIIDIDCAAVKGPRSMVYQQCVGAGRVAEGLRADWQVQLKTCKDAIGFQYLRCHGLLHDELGVYREDKQGNAIYDWQYIDMVYDYLLSIHVRPFVEIGFMPDALASIGLNDPNPPKDRKLSTFWWKANVTPPKSYDKWDALIKALVTHWTERYGANEVAQWYFEIWNEPNHHSFFSPVNEAKRRDEYFELYAHTANAVKSVNAAYRVGGPAATGPVWIPELITYCATNKLPVDFISHHAYGVSTSPGRVDPNNTYGGGGLDESGNKRLWVNRNLRTTANNATASRKALEKAGAPSLPVHITEWSSSYSSHDPVHDGFFEAPYILEQLKHTESVASMSYWTFSDIFEEIGPPPTPFEGGFGLINLQGIKKPAFFAFSFLNQLGNTELVDLDERSWAARDQAGGIQALFWDLTELRARDELADDWDFFRCVLVPKPKGLVTLKLRNLKPGAYHLSIFRVGYEKNDAYTAYLKMGHPSQINLSQVAELKGRATGAADENRDIKVDEKGTWQAEFPMREDDVMLVKLNPA